MPLKAKGKGKGKSKAKAKGKRGGRGGGRAATLPVAEGAPVAGAPSAAGEAANGVAEGEATNGVVGEGAIVVVKPKAKAKGNSLGALRKKIINDLGEGPIEPAMEEAKEALTRAEAFVQEAQALEDAKVKAEDDAKNELAEVQGQIAGAMETESSAQGKWKELNDKKREAGGSVDKRRVDLYEAQKKLAMLEVMALQEARMKELEARRKAATEAAEAAKRGLLEQRQKEKEALEATRKALQEAKAASKRATSGGGEPPAKSPAKSPPNVAAEEAENGGNVE